MDFRSKFVILGIYRYIFTEVAVSASSNEIHIFEWKNGDWINVHTLDEHDLPVTGRCFSKNTFLSEIKMLLPKFSLNMYDLLKQL